VGIARLEAAPVVDAFVDSMTTQAHFPLDGTLTITHEKGEHIDPQSFVMEDKPLPASFVKKVNMSASSETVISIYSFQLPAHDKGLYVLPSIAMKVGGKMYETTPSTYEVQETASSQHPPPLSSQNPSSPLIFRLEASVKGPSTLYPGERTTLFYRISYNRSVDLTRSVLPLIHPSHVQKIGDVQIQDYQLGEVTVQDLTQQIQASEQGTFSFGPSLIEGYAYTVKGGQKIYDPSLLTSEAPLVVLEVKPLPETDQPPSFTGALGQIKAEGRLDSSDQVVVGDLLKWQIKTQGILNLTEFHLPPLECQPGFSGFFQISDLPPLAEVKEGIKIFYVELRVLTALATHIPALELSSFDPATGKYIVQEIAPIPITVTPTLVEKETILFTPLLADHSSRDHWPIPLLSPLEIEGEGMKMLGIEGEPTSSLSVFWIIPVGCLFLLLQYRWHQQWQPRFKEHIPKSHLLFKQALKTGSLSLLEEAFWLRLWEKGSVPQGTFQADKIPDEGGFVSVKKFLFELQALQYSPNKAFDPLELQKHAKKVFEVHLK